MGFTLPVRIAPAAVRSYRTFSPLLRTDRLCPRRYVFCGTFRKNRFERFPPAVSRHAALWRPDFPLNRSKQAIQRLPVRQVHQLLSLIWTKFGPKIASMQTVYPFNVDWTYRLSCK